MVSAVHAIRQNLTCACGKVKLALDAKDVLRFTCYCKDCRGYYNTLNENLQGVGNALLDPWGGVDYLHVYPPEIKILTGKDQLAIEVIRPGSQVNRVYAKCCNTPLFSIGATGTLSSRKDRKRDSRLLTTNLACFLCRFGLIECQSCG